MYRKSIFDKSVLTFIGVLCIVALLSILIKGYLAFTSRCPEIKILVSENKITAGIPFIVHCESNTAEKWDWNFGDGTTNSLIASPTHIYEKAGQYIVTVTVNEKCAESLTVTAEASNLNLPKPIIDAPTTATVGQPVKFKEVSGLGKSWEWSFTDSKSVDSRQQESVYTFSTPGQKTVSVKINGPGNSDVAYFELDITTADIKKESLPVKELLSESEFIIMLYQIIDRKKDATIFKDALCGHLNIVANINGENKPFEEYCKEIKKSHHRTVIDNLKLVIGSSNCIKGITIKQHQGKWRL